jgi:hypothetical protein
MWETLRSLTFRGSSCVQGQGRVEEGVTSGHTDTPEPVLDAQLWVRQHAHLEDMLNFRKVVEQYRNLSFPAPPR